ncbi:hypothetical protein ACVIU7_004528 [Bradyrhizobium liaoningense]
MRGHDRLRDREAEAKSRRFVHGAGFFSSHEGLQHRRLLLIGYSRTVVDDVDDDLVPGDQELDANFGSEACGVFDQVGDRADDFVRPDDECGSVRTKIVHRVAAIGKLVANHLEQRGNVDQCRSGSTFTAQQREHRLEHRLHLIEVAYGLGALCWILDVFRA